MGVTSQPQDRVPPLIVVLWQEPQKKWHGHVWSARCAYEFPGTWNDNFQAMGRKIIWENLFLSRRALSEMSLWQDTLPTASLVWLKRQPFRTQDTYHRWLWRDCHHKYWARSKRGQLWKVTDGGWGLLYGLKRWRHSQILWKKNCVYLCPTWFGIYVVSYCSKFVVKVDSSSGGCQKLPKWVKITDQNADLLQLVRKIFYSKSWRKKIQLILQYYATLNAFGHS